MITLLRTLTLKSKLGFGYNCMKDRKLEDLLILKADRARLVSIYFKLERIDFIPEVLDLLGIKKEHRISKPGKDYELYELHYNNRLITIHGVCNVKADGDDKARKKKFKHVIGRNARRNAELSRFSKSRLAWKNQGHCY